MAEAKAEEEEEDLSLTLPPLPAVVRDAESGRLLRAQHVASAPWTALNPIVTPAEARAARLTAEVARRVASAAAAAAAAKAKAEADAKAERIAARKAAAKAKRMALLPFVEPLLDEAEAAAMPRAVLGHALAERRFRIHARNMAELTSPLDEHGQPVLIRAHRETAAMLRVQAVRDGQQRHLVEMLALEEEEEKRRVRAAKAASVNKDALKWVAKRNAAEREEARLKVERVRHDNEIALLCHMRAVGLIN